MTTQLVMGFLLFYWLYMLCPDAEPSQSLIVERAGTCGLAPVNGLSRALRIWAYSLLGFWRQLREYPMQEAFRRLGHLPVPCQ